MGLASGAVRLTDDLIETPRLVDALLEVGKALLTDTECEVMLDPDENPDRSFKTVLTVKSGGKVSLHGMWLPSMDVPFQHRLATGEASYRSLKPQSVWRNSPAWVGLGAGMSDFLDFVRALTFLIPFSVGGSESIAEVSNLLYEKISELSLTSSGTMDEAEEVFIKLVDHLSNKDGEHNEKTTTSLLKNKVRQPSFLERFVGKEVSKGVISRKCGEMAITKIEKAQKKYHNAFVLNHFTKDADMFISKVNALIEKEDQEMAQAASTAEREEAAAAAAAAEAEDDDGGDAAEADRERGDEILIDTQPLLTDEEENQSAVSRRDRRKKRTIPDSDEEVQDITPPSKKSKK